MIELPKISVVFPVYNAEKYVEEAIDSILNQTFIDFEFIIINDGSTDNSLSIINKKVATDSRIVLLSNDKNRGLIYTLNRGLKTVRGEYIARMDADDIAMPERFAKQVAFLNANSDIIAVGSNYQFFGNAKGVSNLKTSAAAIKLNLFFENAIAHPTVMMRKKVLTENEILYNSAFLHLEDWGLWLDLSSIGKIANLPDCLLKYRVEGQNISQLNLSTLEKRAKALYVVYLPMIYSKPIDDELLSRHWNFAKTRFVHSSISELQKEIKEMEQILLKSTLFEKEAISQFIAEKKVAFFYKIADVSGMKALFYLFKTGLVRLKLVRYAFAVLFSK